MEQSAVGAVEEAPRMNFFARLIGIYFEPAKTFADISRYRSWLAMFLLVCIVTLATSFTLQYRMDPADAARKGVAMMKPIFSILMSPEQITQMEEQAAKQALQPRGPFQKVSAIVMTPLMLYLTYVVLAAIFLLAYTIMGAGISFRQSFTTAIWGMGPPSVVVMLLSVLFMFIKNPLDLDVNPAANVVSNLGMLVDGTANPALHSLLSSVDLFSIWTVVLLSLGFSAMTEGRMKPGKAAVPIVVLLVIWIAIKVGFWSLVS